MLRGERDRFYRGFAQTISARESWKQANNAGDAEYDAYIDQQVADYKANPFASVLYTFTDPMDTRKSSQYLSMAAANLIRSGVVQGNAKSPLQTQALIKGLFTDESGKYAFDKTQFGYMSQTEVSALTAALTKETDLSAFISGGAGTQEEQLKAAASKFKDKVQGYAKALGPLKDVFGKDIPGMLQTIEQISGQTLAQMTPERAQQIATSVADSIATGKYSLAEVSAMNTSVGQIYSKMDIDPMARLMAPSTSLSVLDSINGGLRPSTMTNADFARTVADTRIRQSASSNTRYTAMAYGLWKQKNPEGTWADFQKAANDAGYQTNPTAALLKLTGQTSVQGLNAGLMFAESREALTSGNAARMNESAAFERTLTAAGIALQRNAALASSTGISDSKQREQAIASGLAILRNNTEVFSMSEKDLQAWLTENYKDDAANIAKVINVIKADQKLMAAGYANYNQQKQQNAVQRAGRMRAAMDKGINLPPDVKGLVANFIAGGGDTKNFSEIAAAFNKQLKLDSTADEGRTIAGLRIMGSIFANAFIEDPDNASEEIKEANKKQRENIAAEFVQYGASVEGQLNEGFQAELAKIQKEGATQEDRLEAAKMAHVYMAMGNDAVERFLGDEKNTEQRAARRKRLLGEKDMAKRLNIAHNTMLSDALDEAKKNSHALREITTEENFGTLLTGLESSDAESLTAISDKIKELREKEGIKGDKTKQAALDQLQTIVNEVSGATNSGSASLQDVLDRLWQVLEKLTPILNQWANPNAEQTPKTVTKE